MTQAVTIARSRSLPKPVVEVDFLAEGSAASCAGTKHGQICVPQCVAGRYPSAAYAGRAAAVGGTEAA